MTQYTYVGGGDHYQGLPMVDLDDATLTDEQIALLAIALQRGLFETVRDLQQVEKRAQASDLLTHALGGMVQPVDIGDTNDGPTDDTPERGETPNEENAERD